MTLEKLKELNACEKGIKWFKDFNNPDVVAIINQLMIEDRFEWANWLIPRLLNRDKCISYALECMIMVVEPHVSEGILDSVKRKSLEEIHKHACEAVWIYGYGSIVACALWCMSELKPTHCAAWATHAGTHAYGHNESLKTKIIKHGLELLNEPRASTANP